MNDPLSPDFALDASDASAEPDSSRSTQLAEFNRELNDRIASLDRREYVDPALIRARLAAKSAERRNLR